jgi:hypothetical protein
MKFCEDIFYASTGSATVLRQAQHGVLRRAQHGVLRRAQHGVLRQAQHGVLIALNQIFYKKTKFSNDRCFQKFPKKFNVKL